MRRIFFCSLMCLAVASPAFASGGGKKSGGDKKPKNQFKASWSIKDKSKSKVEVDDKKAGQGIDLPMVILPVSDQGQLQNYIYLSIRINLQDDQDPWPIRAKSHFVSDAIIRQSHKSSSGLVDEKMSVNEDKLQELIQNAIQPWVANEDLSSIEFLKMDVQ